LKNPEKDPSPEQPIDTSSIELARLAAGGDRRALGQLYERHHERALRYAAQKMGTALGRCDDDIHEVAQQAWADATDALLAGRFDPDRAPGAFRKWLGTIIANRVRDRGRAAGRRKEQALATEPLGAGPGPATGLAFSDTYERVEEALVLLSESEREAVLLRHLCGMSSEEACAELGLERAEQVRWLVARGLRRLRQRLGKLADDWVEHNARL